MHTLTYACMSVLAQHKSFGTGACVGAVNVIANIITATIVECTFIDIWQMEEDINYIKPAAPDRCYR